MSLPAPLVPADGAWLLARVANGLPIDGFDPDDLPYPYPQLIAAATRSIGGPAQQLVAVNVALGRLTPEEREPVLAALHTVNPREPRAAARSRSRTAAQMLRADLPAHRWLVDGLLARPGLTVLGGRPKVGKSWLALQLARAVALGAAVLGRTTPQPGAVLYYVLEDGPARLQSRLHAAGWTGGENVRFLFGDALPSLDLGGLVSLESDLVHRRPALVVIDSFAAAKSSHLAENDGGQVAELMYTLARLCSALDLAMLVVHHHRKDTTGSPLADLRGSGALGGAADSILALYRERSALECRLGLDARDSAGGDWTLRFTGAGWQLVGDGVLSTAEKDQLSLLRAFQSLDPAGVSRSELLAVTGMRRQDALAALKVLVANETITRTELPPERGGSARAIYRLSASGSGSQPTP